MVSAAAYNLIFENLGAYEVAVAPSSKWHWQCFVTDAVGFGKRLELAMKHKPRPAGAGRNGRNQ